MDMAAKAGQPRTESGMAVVDFAEHRCVVPGYLHLPDLAMFWPCEGCGEFWRVVVDRKAPGSPLEFVWVRDPIQPDGAPELGWHRAASFAEGS